MNNEITVRKANRKDINLVLEIFRSAINVMVANGILQWDDIYPDEKILYEDIQKNQMFLGEIDGKIVSIFTLNQECDEEYKNGNWNYKRSSFAVIHRFCVNTNFQHMGIGTKIMNIIEEMLKEDKIETIRLDAFSLNPYALKLYENLGYIKVGAVNWRKGLFYLYEKKLQ